MPQLAQKRLIVIGGTTGLGLSAARHFVREGANVVVTGRSEENVHKAREALGEDGWALVSDASDPASAEKAIAQCRERFGGFEGLYHVAGGSGRRMGDGPLHAVTDEGVEATLRLNLHTLIFSNRAAVRAFEAMGQGGAILNMGSVLGYAPSPDFFSTHVYAAAKAAIIGFTKSIAAYYANRDIRVNVIAPGLVETPMAQRAATDAKILDFIAKKQPLDGGRIGRPEDLDAAAALLLSEAGKMITGQVLAVDGGWNVSEGRVRA
ncbi:MAG: SDR family NAD(P)-dependent oxidoreductase [Opitutales bacterium]